MAERPGSPRCARVQDELAELAMDVVPGDVRAVSEGHLAGCARCRRDLVELATVVDELLLLAPEHEPAPGFDARVVAAFDRRSRGRIGTVLLRAAAVVLVAALGAGLVRWWDADDRSLASQYRETLAVADGSYLRAADLTVAGAEAGHVFAYEGAPSWILVTVESAESGGHLVRMVTTDGRTVDLGTCRVRDGRGSWGTTIDVPIRAVARVELVKEGRTTMAAQFG